MISHRITKYNPSKRKSDGSYSDQSEWTAISDIGNPKYNSPTYEEYEATEDAYVNAIILALKEKNVDRLTIKDLELYNSKKDFDGFVKDGRLRNLTVDFNAEIKSLSNGDELTIEEIAKIARLILRETIWMNLESKRLTVIFGNDYYMYISCEPLSKETTNDIESKGLFVEPEIKQRNVVLVDKDGNEF